MTTPTTSDLHIAAMRDRDIIAGKLVAMTAERDAYRSMLCDLLSAAVQGRLGSPNMSRHWDRARDLLKNGPQP